MSKIPYKLALASAIGGVLMLSGLTTVTAADYSRAFSADDLTAAATQPSSTADLSADTDGMYLVRLDEPAVAVYDGGINGLEATSAQATGSERLNTKSNAAKKYKEHLEGRQATVLRNAGNQFGRKLDTAYTYQWATNGFATLLTADEAKALRNMDGVVSVEREKMHSVQTDAGPEWIGAPSIWSQKGRIKGNMGQGVVVAVLDTGINSDHPSFAAMGADGYHIFNPLGTGNYVPGSYCDTVDPGFCNDKLIGAWDFDLTPSDGDTPEDDDGHGSHTASTAAGNFVDNAQIDAPTATAYFDISGVAPHANIIAYDVCHWTADGGSCPGAATAAAIDQVLVDAGNLPYGIAALNYSISGGEDPWNEYVELGFLAAVKAGVYVAASAGNSGPDAGTVGHYGPWVSTTAASTHNRRIVNALTDLTSDGTGASDISGLGLTSAYGPAPIVYAADYEGMYPGATLCGVGDIGDNISPFPPNFFHGEIVVCTRGTFGRVEKGINVLFSGAGGMVLIDNGGGLVADSHVLPGVHITAADGVGLVAWLTANTGNNPMATIEGFSFNYDASNGDIMAGFSSRGPQLAFSSLKPDISGPGVDIMGADSDVFAQYQIISGTSMSSPHNAGSAALIAATKRHLDPTEIKSQLMLTSSTKNMVKEDGSTPADPFDMGAGRLSLDAANNAGLAMYESYENFMAANPAEGGDPSSLNLASMQSNNCVGMCSWTREVWNPENKTGHWNVSAWAPDGVKLAVEVSPEAKGKNNLKLKPGQSARITVTADTLLAADGWSFGKLKLDRNGNSGPDLHMPIAINSSKATDATLFTKMVDKATATAGSTLTYELSVTNGQLVGPVVVEDMVPYGTTFVPGSATQTVVNGSTNSPWNLRAGNSLSGVFELDPGGIAASLVPGGLLGYVPLAQFGPPVAFPANCDDGGSIYNIPTFTYNGANYSQVIWSVNGTIEAGTASGVASSFANQDLPDPAAPNNIMAPFWRDLNGCAGGSWNVAVLSLGPYQWTVFEWTDIPHFGSTDAVTMQVWLYSSTSPVGDFPEVHYAYARLDNPAAGGTIGAENADGTIGDSLYYNGTGVLPTPDPGGFGDDVMIEVLNGGSATLGFQVTTDACATVVNEAEMRNDGNTERAIAVTTCP